MTLDSTTWLGIFAGALTTTSFLPQVWKTWRTRHTKDISIFMFLMLFIGITLWVAYGIVRQDLPVIIANCVSLFFVAIILFFKVRNG
ncbi:MAG: SemiSWEET transporter [Deltaproteobacteria bacterium]|nr:SemiSWEET transporter [Deltaproteobacteria bacterium]